MQLDPIRIEIVLLGFEALRLAQRKEREGARAYLVVARRRQRGAGRRRQGRKTGGESQREGGRLGEEKTESLSREGESCQRAELERACYIADRAELDLSQRSRLAYSQVRT